MKRQRKLVTQQIFTCQELQEQQRNGAVKSTIPLLFSQTPENKGFLRKQLSTVLSKLVVHHRYNKLWTSLQSTRKALIKVLILALDYWGNLVSFWNVKILKYKIQKQSSISVLKKGYYGFFKKRRSKKIKDEKMDRAIEKH